MNGMEKLLWSIAFPGFAQLLNGKYVKGIIFILIEIVVNVKGNFNQVIMLSFLGDIEAAIEQTNYQWLMFYPCLYFFAAWDAYKEAGGGKSPYAYLPFVFSAYFVTVGLMYSPVVKIYGVKLGPVWLPILSCFVGVGIGLLIRKIILLASKKTVPR